MGYTNIKPKIIDRNIDFVNKTVNIILKFLLRPFNLEIMQSFKTSWNFDCKQEKLLLKSLSK